MAAVLLAVLAVVAVAACRGPDPVPAAATVPIQRNVETVRVLARASVLVTGEPGDIRTAESIRVTPSQVVADVGSSVPLAATVLDNAGLSLDDVALVWSVSDPRAGRISETGLFNASRAPGTYREAITVTVVRNSPQGLQTVASSIDVTVVGEAAVSKLASVSVFPEQTSVATNQVYRMRAAAFDERGQLIPQVNLVWSVDDKALGRINQLGYLTVLGAEGTYRDALTVTAVWDGETLTRTIDVSVTSAQGSDDFLAVQALPETFRLHSGDQLQLAAVALDARGELVRNAQIRWSVVDPSAGSVDGNGLFTAADGDGVFTEAVRVEAVVLGPSGILNAENFVNVVVLGDETVRQLAAVRVIPSPVIAPTGSRLLMIAQASDESGAPTRDTRLIWEALDSRVGQIDAAGSLKLTGEPGVYTQALKLTAVQRPNGGDEEITVIRLVDVVITGRLHEVAIEPNLGSVVPGRTIHFGISARDELGNDLTGLTVLWRVTDPAAGTIDPFGNFTAGADIGLYEDAIVAEVIQSLPLPD